ncbi:GNAT family N-acetyltransferase [bacterium]|nr:GNAT family N-acetyltransferase [bacterium]
MQSQKSKVTAGDVDIRPFLIEDLKPFVKYWTDSPEEFWRERGVDTAKIKPPEELYNIYSDLFQQNGGLPKLATILLKGEAVGAHSLTDFVEETSAVFHAHIWSAEHRGLGIGTYSYLKGADFFFKTLKLKKILFKTPKINRGANRLKEKLGIQALGETIFDFPLMISPLEAILYELDQESLKELMVKHGIKRV